MSPKDAIHPVQVRAARAALGLHQSDLATASKVSVPTIKKFENGHGELRELTLDALRRSLEEMGVEFTKDENGRIGFMIHPGDAKRRVERILRQATEELQERLAAQGIHPVEDQK